MIVTWLVDVLAAVFEPSVDTGVLWQGGWAGLTQKLVVQSMSMQQGVCTTLHPAPAL